MVLGRNLESCRVCREDSWMPKGGEAESFPSPPGCSASDDSNIPRSLVYSLEG